MSDPGPGVDRFGQAADPSSNVLALVDAGARRADDLAEERTKRIDAELAHLKELIDVNAKHSKELRVAESERVDAVRMVDQLNVGTALDAQNKLAETLATQVVATAEAGRTTAAATELKNDQALRQAVEPINRRLDSAMSAINDLQASRSEGTGAKAQTTESRLSLGGAVAIVGVVAVIFFGMATVVIALITQT